MSISATGSDYWKNPSSVDNSKKTGNNLSDFDSFVKLLATELQYQDPSEPVSNTEYVSQMAQINSLQQLQTIGNSMASSQAYSMIGKEVSYQITDSTGAAELQTGTVQSVISKDGKPYLNINNQLISTDSVLEVSNTAKSIA